MNSRIEEDDDEGNDEGNDEDNDEDSESILTFKILL
jgi:hypothetical protein